MANNNESKMPPAEAPETDEEGLMFDVEPREQAGEHLRQTLTLLADLQVPPAPLFYSLLYNYNAGSSERLNRELDALLDHGPLDRQSAILLFKRFLSTEGESLLEDIRRELVSMVSQVIGALIDVAGKTALSNEEIAKHIECITSSNRPDEIVAEASAIISHTRAFVTNSRELESGLTSSVEEMHRLKQELTTARREASIDSLTGLFNRRAFDFQIDDLVTKSDKAGEEFCLLMLDVDNFKACNDRYGHLVGDKILSEIANRIGKQTRRSDFVARFGGEEFAVLLPATHLSSGFTVAENVRRALEKMRMRRANSGELIEPVTVSIGVGVHRRGESIEALLCRCDDAMYKAKRLGRNRTLIAD